MPETVSIALSPINRLLSQETRLRKFDVADEIESRARELLESQPHFRGRCRWVQCQWANRRLVLTGQVPTYYLKQLAQEAVREIEGVDLVINRILVAGTV